MHRFRSIITALVFCLLCFPSGAQSPGYLLETFGTRNGMLSSKIYSLAQARNRMLWVGTELGVSSFNGYNFTNYQYTGSNESIGRILAIAEDSLGGIWVGGDKGLFYLDDDKNFRKIRFSNRATLAIEALLTDTKGRLWVGEMNGLFMIPADQIQKIYSSDLSEIPITPHGNFLKRVFSISEDRQHQIYTSSYEGVYRFAANSDHYQEIWKNPDPNLFVRTVTAISTDSIYWNRLDSHPEQMVRGVVQMIPHTEYIGRVVFKYRDLPFALTTSGVAAIENNNTRLIVSHTGVSNNAVAALIDAEENIWVGSWEGLLKYRKTSFHRYSLEHERHTEVFSMLEKKDGQLLFGSNRGLVFTYQDEKLVPAPGFPPLFRLAEVMCMTEAPDGSLWFGSGYQGISRMKDNVFTHFGRDSLLKDENCEQLFLTGSGQLLASTEQGVTLIDPASPYPMKEHYPFQGAYTRYPELFGCFQVPGSAYWFYGSQGLYILKNGKLHDDSIDGMPIKSLYINKIITDKKENIWIATQGKGILKCSYEKGRLRLEKQYNLGTGALTDNALSVLADNKGNIWWGDYMSLYLLNNPGSNEQLVHFNEKDGLLASYYQTLKLEQQKNGNIWGLTTMGAFSFHPDSVGRNLLPPVLHLDRVRDRDGNIISHHHRGIFPHNRNSLQFDFTAVSLTDPSKIRYAYRLAGQDTNWSYTQERHLSFNFLPPGHYTLELIACNNYNIWTPEPLQYSFTIRPPFWQQWWFRLLVLTVIGLILFYFLKRRISAVKNRARIQQQMTELESRALRAQMNPHFIFNSLNAIQELIVTKNFPEAYQYLSSFSKLLRMVLNNSEKNFISLEAELDMIRQYLNLESLRFKQSFHYNIQVDPSIEIETTLVPSLLLQPFLENAIWHGLMNKEGEKSLGIYFAEGNGQLVCRIEDNGIGRDRAGSIKSGKMGFRQFESKGIPLTQQRIAMLNQQLKENMSIEIEDIRDANGQTAGTRVLIRLSRKTTLNTLT